MCPILLAANAEAILAAPLASAHQIRAMAPAEAARSLPVRIRGIVVQGIRSGPEALVLWDGSEAIYVVAPGAVGAAIRHGQRIEIEGVTEAGDFAPIIAAQKITVLGVSDLPDPLKTTVSEVSAGKYDANWVELEAIVHGFSRVGDGSNVGSGGDLDIENSGETPTWILDIEGGNSRMKIRLEEADIDVYALLDARVRFRGACYSVHNANRQFVRATMVVTGAEFVSVISPAPLVADLPVTRADALLQFSRHGFSGHRVKVQGVVTHHEPGRALWIRDGERGLEVVTNQQSKVEPGTLVEVIGFAEHGSYAPRLTDAIFQTLRRVDSPEPTRIVKSGDSIAHEANLVELEGELFEVRESDEGYSMSLRWNGETIHAVLVSRDGKPLPRLELTPGTQLRLAGICSRVPQAWSPQIGLWRLDKFQILLRSRADIVVIAAGPWLTGKRAIYLLAIAAGLLLVVIVAIVISARRAIARRRHEREMAEAEFSAMLKERNRVARDIHDTLAQGLNAVSMQLELAKNASESNAETSGFHVKTAHEIVRSCIADARESIWNMRSHILDRTDLPGALEVVLKQLGAAHTVDARVEIEGLRRRLPPTLENDLLRVGQEAIANAFKHAEASSLVVRVVFTSTGIHLSIEDDGRGFDPAVSSTATSRFGLKGMRERTELMHGILEIRSGRAKGTVVKVEIGDANPEQ